MKSYNKQKAVLIYAILIVSTVLLLPVQAVRAAGELMVAPTRVVFDNRTRSAKLNLINTGTETSTYRIQLVRKRMTETGGFVDITEPLPGELFVDNMVRFSPRQVTLPPGQSQVIRLILRKPANLAFGEYRSHLLFRALPSTQRSRIDPATEDNQQRFNIQLIPVLGISIPIIVRHGNVFSEVAFEEVNYHSGEKPYISFSMKRSGNQSVYGDLIVSFIDANNEKKILAQANGVAIYFPNLVRRSKLQLHPPSGLEIANGKLMISYYQTQDDGGKLLAEHAISIP